MKCFNNLNLIDIIIIQLVVLIEILKIERYLYKMKWNNFQINSQLLKKKNLNVNNNKKLYNLN